MRHICADVLALRFDLKLEDGLGRCETGTEDGRDAPRR